MQIKSIISTSYKIIIQAASDSYPIEAIFNYLILKELFKHPFQENESPFKPQELGNSNFFN